MKSESKIFLASILVCVTLLGGLIAYSSATKTNLDNNEQVDPKTLIKSDTHQVTTAPLKVTIVEFGDFQCPACGLAHVVVKQLLKDYSGNINFAFRHFPLPMHKNAVPAAIAAEAAGKQNKFWEFHDALYERQAQWENLADTKETFVGYAKELGLNEAQFRTDLDSTDLKAKVEADRAEGVALGINQTPTFYINNLKFNGTLSLKDFKTAIDSEMKK